MKYGLVQTEKLYFSSSEAARQVGVPVDILLSWEKEYPNLNPKKNANGKRVYHQNDIEIAKKIKDGQGTEEQVKENKERGTGKREKLKIDNGEMRNGKKFLMNIRDKLQGVLNNIKDR